MKFGQWGLLLLLLVGWVSCGGGGKDKDGFSGQGVFGPNVSGTPTTFRGAGIINDAAFLIGGPMAQGRTGDILIQNDKVRLIIQKPTRNTGLGTFGGNLIDADLMRSANEPGQDNFAVLFPALNVSWTANYQKLEILNADFSQGPVVVRATGVLDVYDYIQASIIVPFAKFFNNVTLYFDVRFNDLYDPFENILELRNVSSTVVTDYILKPDQAYLMIQTHLFNQGSEPIPFPVGEWVNGSGLIETFIPKQGYVKAAQQNNIPAILYSGLEDNITVSYGFFYDPMPFLQEDGTLKLAGGLNIPGVVPIFFGEEDFLHLVPLASDPHPKIRNTLNPGTNTYTRYFSVGDGDINSALQGGFDALGVSKVFINGKVVDSQGAPVDHARVVILQADKPVSMIWSKTDGSFNGIASSGVDVKAQMFGNGKYTLEVYKEGYLLDQGPKAGKCTSGSFDKNTFTVSGVNCTLGPSGTVAVNVSSGGKVSPARITIVGFDPSPIHPVEGAGGNGKYSEISLSERPYGIVDVLYYGPDGKVHPNGSSRVISDNQFRLEPGQYKIYVTRGFEYSVYSQSVNIAAGGKTTINAALEHVLATPGYIGMDLHLHSINSADSSFGLVSRVYAALGEGMDVILSTDHDFVTDYKPVVQALNAQGYIGAMAGDEITPLALGHFLAFPLVVDPNSTTGGAYDYTLMPSDDPANPSHDYVQGPGEMFKNIDAQNPGTQVLQLAHVLDPLYGNLKIAGLVTSTLFPDAPPLYTVGDPVNYRLHTNTNSAGGFQAPFPPGTNELMTFDFTALELIVGAYADVAGDLFNSALPTYFNMLNLGLIKTATGSSDSHVQIREPIGSPRNYIRSSVDPRDGFGNQYSSISEEEVAVNTNGHQVIVSNGPYIQVVAKSADATQATTIGGTITGGHVDLEIKVSSIEYVDWDTVEIYTNADGVPAMDAMDKPYQGPAKNFFLGIPIGGTSDPQAIKQRYFTKPKVKLVKGNGFEQTIEDGVRRATINQAFDFNEDTWIVMVVRSSNNVKSMFPIITKGIDPTKVTQADFFNKLQNAPHTIGGVKAFAFTNPVFIDVDGNGFVAKYVASGVSPL